MSQAKGSSLDRQIFPGSKLPVLSSSHLYSGIPYKSGETTAKRDVSCPHPQIPHFHSCLRFPTKHLALTRSPCPSRPKKRSLIALLERCFGSWQPPTSAGAGGCPHEHGVEQEYNVCWLQTSPGLGHWWNSSSVTSVSQTVWGVHC